MSECADTIQTGERVAITGMGCRFPGDVDSAAALWGLLADGRDAVSERPPGRAELWPAPASRQSETEPPAARWGGFLPDVTGFDADFFGVSRREADLIDPQHRLLLEVAWEALEHAGLPPERLAGTPTGVFTGLSYTEYMERLGAGPEALEGSVLANGSCVAAGRISYLLGLNGPSVVLDTACSSSLVALHLACQALRTGECDIALAGGVSLVLSQRMTLSFARVGMLSPTGRCHAFDAAADGFVRGEGCGVVVLRRLADAIADGDRILAVVRGSTVNSDGRSDGLAAPSASAQRAVLSTALRRAGADPGDVGMIEAHGTGTPVGDPIEFASLAAVYGAGQHPCALTSVKTNLGHLEPAAGVSGLIKAVLCLQRGLIPPNLHFTRWNPDIAADGTRFFVPTEMVGWPNPRQPRLAAVSSFGFSGTNAHVLLEQAPSPVAGDPGLAPPAARAPHVAIRQAPEHAAPEDPAAPESAAATEPEVFLVAAGSAAALPRAAARLADWLDREGRSVALRDVAHTLALRRSHGRGRAGVVACSRADLADGLRSFAAGQAHPRVTSGTVGAGVSRRPVWVFSGQGSQWPGMGREFLQRDAAFAAALAEADPLIAAEAGFSVLDVVRTGQPVTGCGRVQPLLFAIQVALAAAWRAHGVEPAGVIGHSMGEVAAAVVAGALSLTDGARVICRRSSLLTRITGAGAMATVGLDRPAVESELDASGASGTVSVAVLAAPRSTVVAGETSEVTRLTAAWESRGIPARLIAVDVASHSPQVDPLLNDLTGCLDDLTPRAPQLPFYSTVLDRTDQVPAFDAAYWSANLRGTVRFAAAVAAAAEDRCSVFVEVSPHPVVTRAISDSLEGLVRDPVVLPTLRRDEDELATFRTQLAALQCAGVTVDWRSLYGDAQLADVPSITFDRRRHWVDVKEPAPHAPHDPDGGSPLLGARTEVPGERVRHSWRGDAGTAAVPWLADHRVHGHPVMPGAGLCAMALTAACEAFAAPAREVEVTDLRFRELLRLAEHTEVSTAVTMATADRGECEIFARGDDGSWVRHATATVRRVPDTEPRPEPTAGLAAESGDPADPAALYEGMRTRGIDHGPAFAGITQLRLSEDGRRVWARVAVPEGAAAAPNRLLIHPVLLDACALAVAAGIGMAPGQGLVLPTEFSRTRVHGDPATVAFCHAEIDEQRRDGAIGHARLLDEAGNTVASIDGLALVRRAELSRPAVDRWFVEAAWRPSPRREHRQPARPGSWLVFGESDGSAQALAAALSADGATTDVLDLPLCDSPLGQLRDRLAQQWSASLPAPRGAVMVCAPDPDGTGPRAALRRTRQLLEVTQAIAATWEEPPRLYVVTGGAQPLARGDEVSVGQGSLRGIVRVLAHEQPRMRATHLDIDPDGTTPETLARELLAGAPEDEIALRGEDRYVAEADYAPLSDTDRAAAVRPVRYGVDGFRLRPRRAGELRSLELVGALRRPPGPGEVEVRVQAAGVNFRDVLTVMGLLPAGDGAQFRIGFECAGVVSASGPDVTHLRPGDAVLAIDLRGGAFGSFMTVPATAVALIPEGMNATDAAGLPAVFLTAWYALRHLGRLAAGERVLIHSAAGGTGLAALAVARLTGAEVLATAGSEEKRQYLRGQGIEHVMDSRTLDFTEQTLAATSGEGVDVVLNSLPGPAIRAGIEALRPFGRFVELGVRDILADMPLGLLALRHNITLSTVDLIELQTTRPALLSAMMRELLTEFAGGRLRPLPRRTFPLSTAADAFGLMAGAGHIGKLVLTVPDEGEATAVHADEPPARHDGAYVVTGGLRGVGLATARWLVGHGAGHVVVNGRSPASPAAEQVLADLRAAGSRVTVELGDISEPGTAERLVCAATRDGLPLRGVIHSAMVLADAAVMNITETQLEQVWRPKVEGAWRLHHATAGHDLDWFVLFSSMVSLIGNPGQGAYAAANSWLDSFAAWRAAHGLPALAVNWGPWGETGAATGFAARGYQTIPTGEGLDALAILLAHRRVRAAVIPGEPLTWIPPAVRRSSLLRGLVGEQDSAGERDPAQALADTSVRADVEAAAPGLARRTMLETYLADHIRDVLRLGSATLDPQVSLRSLGFDSLLAMELAARLESGLGVRLPVNFVWTHPTVAALADGVAERMQLSLNR